MMMVISLTNDHPAVKECAVVAKPHDIRGNIVKAFVILQDHTAGDDTLVKELQQFVKMKLHHINIRERLNSLTTYQNKLR